MTRYFLAIIPPEPIAARIDEIKQHFMSEYGSKGALRSPAHITLHMPFQWKETKEERLVHLLAQTTQFNSFEINLNGFGAFCPKTIFIQNEYCQSLMNFQVELSRYTKREMQLFNSTHNRGYNPHITVAFRDLKKEAFEEAWLIFEKRKFETTFTVDSFWLLKHDGKAWQAFKQFRFR
ncbi:MAG: 2'-5' RNA ligase [Candidatus Endobugula sp.]|jgi:2'-5' RNA ligase